MVFPFGRHVELAGALRSWFSFMRVLPAGCCDLGCVALASSESPSASMASGKRLLAASVETYWNDEVKEVTKRAGMARLDGVICE